MAFVTAAAALPRPSALAATSTRPTMSATPLSRRAALRAAALSAAAMASGALAQSFDLKELKEDVEELNYEEEVVDVGPDAAEKNQTRIKKKTPPPAYKAEEKELLKEEDEKYDAMVAKELAEEAKIKASFGKN